MTKTLPIAGAFNCQAFPFGKEAGANKGNWLTCPTCGKPPTHPTAEQWSWPGNQIPAVGFFMFRDELSAREYHISGMCQACQDSVFTEPDE